MNWIWLGLAWTVGALLAWAFIHGATRKQADLPNPYEEE